MMRSNEQSNKIQEYNLPIAQQNDESEKKKLMDKNEKMKKRMQVDKEGMQKNN